MTSTGGAGGSSRASELSVKLNKLFEIMRKPAEPPLSNAAAAEAITKQTGVSISSAAIDESVSERRAQVSKSR